MKKIVASVGLIAVGVSGAYAAYAPGLSTMDTSKPWGIGASLRGFYDDNYACASVNERDSWGFEISPTVKLNLPLEQTYIGARYIYSGRYYTDRADNDVPGFDNDPWDHTHQFDFLFNHAFNERYTFDAKDSFVIGQEPGLMAADGQGNPYPFRAEGDNVRNQAQATFSAQLTRLMGLRVGYNNTLWDYSDNGGSAFQPSLSGLMDRVEHLVSGELTWQALPETLLRVGYSYGINQYTRDEVIGFLMFDRDGNYYGPVMSGDRDNTAHYFYGGVSQTFLRNMTASLKAGATYLDYDNDAINSDNWMPYVDASLNYTYATGSFAQAGFLYTFNSTDAIAPDSTSGTVASSQQSATVYALLNHQITARLAGMLHAHYQNSSYDGGQYDESADDYFTVGLNLTYMVNRHFSCEAGYTFSTLESDVPGRDYDRNRVYVGVTASY
jgi:hypothetical protein